MVRILSVIVVICGFFLAISSFRIKHLENKNTSLETQKNELIKRVEEFNEYQRQEQNAEKVIEKVRYIHRNTNVDTCDCYNRVLDERLLNTIREELNKK